MGRDRDNLLLKMRDDWFMFSGKSFSKKHILFTADLLEAAMKFAGLWDDGDMDPRAIHERDEEQWWEFAREVIYRDVVNYNNNYLDSSYVNEALIDDLAEALPILVQENRDAKRRALEAERERLQKELAKLDEAIEEGAE